MDIKKDNIVNKKWGFEYWFANNEKYCGKLLIIKRNEISSKGKFHYHKNKDETFFVIDGELILDIIDKDNGDIIYEITLKKYQSYRIKPYIKHRFRCENTTDCKFIEVSTYHSDEDSFRVDLFKYNK